MDTSELKEYMLKDPCISLMYGGVVPKDLLPKDSPKQKLYIVNLDKSNKQGSHWITLFLCNDKVTEYFDPLGKEPDEFIKRFMENESTCYINNTKQCQSSLSNTCGQFCLFYCFFRSRGQSMGGILEYFKTNLLYNEALVHEFYALTS